jgi:uncharacterized integral membrane protein
MYRGQSTRNTTENPIIVIVVVIIIIIIIIVIIITTTTTYLLTYLITAVEFSLGGSSPYTSTDKTNKNKYT